METSIQIRNVDKLLRSSEKFRRFFPRTVVRGAKRGLDKTATKIRRAVRGTSVGGHIVRSQWGKGKENKLTARVKVLKPRRGSAKDIELLIGLYGYAAVLEGGGRIVPHTIRGHRHPGHAVIAHGFGGSNLRRDQGLIAEAIDAEIGRLVTQAYGI